MIVKADTIVRLGQNEFSLGEGSFEYKVESIFLNKGNVKIPLGDVAWTSFLLKIERLNKQVADFYLNEKYE